MFNYHGNNYTVAAAANNANRLYQVDAFYEHIANKTFDNTKCSGDVIEALFRTHNTDQVKVVVYRPWWRWSKAIAYYSPKKPNQVNLNLYKIRRMNKHQICGTLMHEVTHLIDGKYWNLSFGHGNNSSVGKQNTAPYWIGRMSKRLSAINY